MTIIVMVLVYTTVRGKWQVSYYVTLP